MSRKDEMQKAVEELRKAIQDKGPQPKYHDEVMRKHRAEWPTLWKAIDKVIGTRL